MITDNIICLGPVGTNSGVTYYVQVPFACQIHTVHATAQDSDIGDADTVTIKESTGTNTIGVATFGSDIAAGAKATYEANATYGNTDFEKDEVIQVIVSSLDASGDRVVVEIELDPYALS